MTHPTQAEIEAALKPKRYTKNPLTIEAFQITEELALAHLIEELPLPFNLSRADATYHPIHRTVSNFFVSIDTLEGKMRAEIGDYIIKGIKGELYPCKPDIFEASYHLSQPQQQEAVGEIDLAGFVDKLFTVHWKNSSCDIDGEDLQEWGEAFGITKAETYDRDLHGSHHEYEWGAVHGESTIYVLSDAFKAMLKAAPPAEDGKA